jgi:hypothetical protein
MDRRTIEIIESCRPGSDDLRDPQFADAAHEIDQDTTAARFYDQTQRQDARIVGAIDQVPVPPGLAERILARLEEHDQAVAATEQIIAATAETQVRLAITPKSRRRWVQAVAATAAIVVVAITFGHFMRPASQPPLELVAAEFLAELGAVNSDWQPMTQAPATAPFPDGVAGTATGWRRLSRGVATAYRVAHPVSGSAVLFVSRMTSENLPGSPPADPQSATGGQAIGFWKVGPRVYMLVVPGNARNYRAFLHAGPTPVA